MVILMPVSVVPTIEFVDAYFFWQLNCHRQYVLLWNGDPQAACLHIPSANPGGMELVSVQGSTISIRRRGASKLFIIQTLGLRLGWQGSSRNELVLDILVYWPGKFMKFHCLFFFLWFFGGCFWWSWGVMCIDRAQGANFWLCPLALAWWFSSPGSFQVKSAEMKEICFFFILVLKSQWCGVYIRKVNNMYTVYLHMYAYV